MKLKSGFRTLVMVVAILAIVTACAGQEAGTAADRSDPSQSQGDSSSRTTDTILNVIGIILITPVIFVLLLLSAKSELDNEDERKKEEEREKERENSRTIPKEHRPSTANRR